MYIQFEAQIPPSMRKFEILIRVGGPAEDDLKEVDLERDVAVIGVIKEGPSLVARRVENLVTEIP